MSSTSQTKLTAGAKCQQNRSSHLTFCKRSGSLHGPGGSDLTRRTAPSTQGQFVMVSFQVRSRESRMAGTGMVRIPALNPPDTALLWRFNSVPPFNIHMHNKHGGTLSPCSPLVCACSRIHVHHVYFESHACRWSSGNF